MVEAVKEIFNYILEAFEEKEEVPAVLCYLTKAYETVNHKSILYTLEKYVMSKEDFKIIKSYLRNRKQKVIIGHKES